MKVKLITLLVFYWVLITTSANGQKLDSSYFETPIATNKIDRAEWKSIVDGVDYTEEIQKKEEKEPVKEKESSDFNFEFIGLFFKFIIIVLGIGLIAFIIVKVMNAESLFTKKDKRISGNNVAYELEEIEENLMETELDASIQKAIQAGNYALAIRLYYLAIIRELALTEALDWKKEKTNFQYLRELRNHPLKDAFSKTTNTFERIWYGEEEIPEERFNKILPDFKQLLDKVKTNN